MNMTRALCPYCLRLTTGLLLHAQVWAPLGPVDTTWPTPEWADHHSMVVDDAGNPVMVFRDPSQSYRTTVKRWESGAWQTVGSPGFSAGMATEHSIALRPDGHPMVAYLDHTVSQRLTVQKLEWSACKWLGRWASLPHRWPTRA
ncbi:MAG: hypothetical protein IPM46_01255 [Flavobacteriales bacterium]|nr:hypothetical protein [Flavobacteriales bacterium]